MKRNLSRYTIYTIWDNRYDNIMANGTSFQCARSLGIPISHFYSMVSRAKSGEIKKYSVIQQSVNKKDYLL